MSTEHARIYIQFADNGNIRKWQREPFDGGAEYVAASSEPTPTGMHGPFGWLNGHRALSEDSWSIEGDPLANSEEYFSIPLYALVDPFKEAGKDPAPTGTGDFEKDLAAVEQSIERGARRSSHRFSLSDPKPTCDGAVVERTPMRDTIAAVMLQKGTPDQQIEALSYIHGKLPVSPTPTAEAGGDEPETYYTKGKDAEWVERLTDKDLAWALTCASQDLNDSDENVSDWMPVSAFLSVAADRIAALRQSKPQALPDGCGGGTAMTVSPKAQVKHPSHVTRSSDASTFDEVCVNCGATDQVPGGWGKLAEPCPVAASPSPSSDAVGWRPIETAPKDGTRILLAWKLFGGLSEHVELGKWKDRQGWSNTYGRAFNGDPDAWAPLAPFALPSAPVSDGGEHGW